PASSVSAARTRTFCSLGSRESCTHSVKRCAHRSSRRTDMADHTRNALAAAARAMRDVIIPAVDPEHPLALEQAKIVARLLDFVEQRIDHVHERARCELLHYRTLLQ